MKIHTSDSKKSQPAQASASGQNYLLIIPFIFKHSQLARNRPESTGGGNEMSELLFVAPFRDLLNLKITDSSNILFSGNSRLSHQDSDPGNMREDAPAKCVPLLLQAKSL